MRTDELTTRELTCRELSLRSDSINEEERSFEAIVASDVRARVFDMARFEVIEEILVPRGGMFPDRIPLLDDHDRSGVAAVMGSAFGFRQEGDVWVGRGRVGRAVDGNIHREQVWRDIADGHIRAVSIGYQVEEATDIQPNQSATVAGRTFEAGESRLRITTAWRVHELSLTPIGADSTALIRKQPGAAPKRPKRRSFFR